MSGVCPCHGEPRDSDRSCRVKRRARQRKYWVVGGWARRRERRLDKQEQRLRQEAEDLGSA